MMRPIVIAMLLLPGFAFGRMSLASKMALWNFGQQEDPSASFYVTTTGAGQTLSVDYITVSASTLLTWGDGTSTNITGAAIRAHTYADAGTYTVHIYTPETVTGFQIDDGKVTLNSADVALMENVTTFRADSLLAGTFDSADVTSWNPTYFYLHSMPAGYAGTFDSADVTSWDPAHFRIYSMPAGYAGTFDSADVTSWNPTYFYLYSMPAGYAGTFDSADVTSWNPTYFYLNSMPAGYAGTFDSADVTSWNPTYFYLDSMPAGYAGTFDSADVTSWDPENFYLYSMPAGYAGTFDSADVTSWNPAHFYLHSMPAGYAGTFDSADVTSWTPAHFYLLSMPAGYAGTFDSADVSGWDPYRFYLYSMPAGYAGTFDSADVTSWNPAHFYLNSMPASYAFTLGANSFSTWTGTTNFRLYDNSLTETQVDNVLYGLYQAAITPRTRSDGVLQIAGNNDAPSGTYQAAESTPVSAATPGAEVAHELKNDGAAEGFNVWATVDITAP